MSDLLIIIPVLGRPQNANQVATSIDNNTTNPCRIAFVCTQSDTDQIAACRQTIEPNRDLVYVLEPNSVGDYAKKINHAYRFGDERYVFLGADDLVFHQGWDVEALRVMHETGAGVVGTNDLANQQTIAGLHSTHSLVDRAYIDRCGGYVGGPGRVYFEGYHHQFVDNELVQTAMARDCYAHAFHSQVKHLHPLWRTAPDDATYRLALRDSGPDRLLFESRKCLWEDEARAAAAEG